MMPIFLLHIYFLLALLPLVESHCFAQDFWPSRPLFKRHQELVKGQSRQAHELYHLQRVGACLNTEQLQLIDQKFKDSSFKLEMHKLQELNCQGSSRSFKL